MVVQIFLTWRFAKSHRLIFRQRLVVKINQFLLDYVLFGFLFLIQVVLFVLFCDRFFELFGRGQNPPRLVRGPEGMGHRQGHRFRHFSFRADESVAFHGFGGVGGDEREDLAVGGVGGAVGDSEISKTGLSESTWVARDGPVYGYF